jgi:hypothetical protein
VEFVVTEQEGQQGWLRELADTKAESDKNWWTAFVLSLLVGYFGVDRFYLGYIWSGILKLLTLGGFGVWWLIDLALLLAGKLRDADDGALKPPWTKKG